MRTIHIFDIDTTIADNSHRVGLLQKFCLVCGSVMQVLVAHRKEESTVCPSCGSTDGKVSQKSWDAFLDPTVVINDSPEPKAVTYMTKLRSLGAEIHFLTGRREYLRSATEQWLSEHFAWNPNSEYLVMRPDGGGIVPASVFKEKAFLDLKTKINGSDAIFFFYEDDPFVFNIYSKYGIVFECPEAFDSIMPTPKPLALEEKMRR